MPSRSLVFAIRVPCSLTPTWYRAPPMDNAVKRMRRGHTAAALQAQQVARAEGPQPARAVAEALSALDALSASGRWPGPRDPVSERGVEEVRARWARIGRRSRDGAR